MLQRLGFSVLLLVSLANSQARPNIILIMADDMGWSDVGANWPLTVDTPTIDQLARDGLRFTDFHAGASICTPSRAALLTGRLGLRTGVVKNFEEKALGGIPRNETTIAEILSEAGYRTAMLGKWHLGTKPGHHPLDKGFQSYLGVPYSVDMGCADLAGANYPPCPACPEENSVYVFAPPPAANCITDTALPLYRDRSIVHQPVSLQNLTSMYSEFATKFIRSQSASPYFLYAALSHMHVPLAHALNFDNMTGRGQYADTLRELDSFVESLVNVVKKTDNNTLIWFTSDNGPWEAKCELAGSVGPFIGMWQASEEGGGGGSVAKRTVWEAGHRVPSIIYWPPHVRAGEVSRALTSALDIFPTLASLGRGNIPANRRYDGHDMTPLLNGTSESIREVLFHPNSGSGEDGKIGALRISKYKVVYSSGGVPDCSGHSGPVQAHDKFPLVFNLDTDLSEGVPLDFNSSEYIVIINVAKLLMFSLEESVRTDNTSTVDYRGGPEGRVCCDHKSPICRCPWDAD